MSHGDLLHRDPDLLMLNLDLSLTIIFHTSPDDLPSYTVFIYTLHRIPKLIKTASILNRTGKRFLEYLSVSSFKKKINVLPKGNGLV